MIFLLYQQFIISLMNPYRKSKKKFVHDFFLKLLISVKGFNHPIKQVFKEGSPEKLLVY